LTRVEFGSMVQKGKFSAGMEQLDRALYSVDLPTLGIPTRPTWGGWGGEGGGRESVD
jgi:hypothetical protein